MSLQRCTFSLIKNAIKLNNTTNQVRYIHRWVHPTLKELYVRKKKMGPEPPQHRSTFLEWNYNSEIFAFGKRLGEEFDRRLLERALTHRSYVVQEELKSQEAGLEININKPDNRELIDEGDRFIKQYLNETLPKLQPNVPTEAIDAAIKYLTSIELLSKVALYTGVKDLILCEDIPVEDTTIADTFKAIVAALLQSSGEEKAKVFLNDLLVVQLIDKDMYDLWNPEQPVQILQQKLEERGITAEPEARLCRQTGVSTILAAYQVGLYIDKKMIGIGWGESIDIAKDVAAIDAIHRLYENKLELNR